MLTQANKNPVIAGVSDYYEDYFKIFLLYPREVTH